MIKGQLSLSLVQAAPLVEPFELLFVPYEQPLQTRIRIRLFGSDSDSDSEAAVPVTAAAKAKA